MLNLNSSLFEIYVLNSCFPFRVVNVRRPEYLINWTSENGICSSKLKDWVQINWLCWSKWLRKRAKREKKKKKRTEKFYISKNKKHTNKHTKFLFWISFSTNPFYDISNKRYRTNRFQMQLYKFKIY